MGKATWYGQIFLQPIYLSLRIVMQWLPSHRLRVLFLSPVVRLIKKPKNTPEPNVPGLTWTWKATKRLPKQLCMQVTPTPLAKHPWPARSSWESQSSGNAQACAFGSLSQWPSWKQSISHKNARQMLESRTPQARCGAKQKNNSSSPKIRINPTKATLVMSAASIYFRHLLASEPLPASLFCEEHPPPLCSWPLPLIMFGFY